MKIPILSNLKEKRSLAKFDEFLDYLVTGGESSAGVKVNEKTALNSTAVFSCVRVLSETIASLPLPVYKRLEPRGKERAGSHPLYKLLHDAPNPYMTSFAFRETLMSHLVTWGNAYADIDWLPNGQVRALWPLRPDKVKDVKFIDGKLKYIYTLPTGEDRILDSGRVFHLAGLGFDGYVGYSPIAMARNAVGLAMATEEYGGKFFRNGAKPGGVLRHPGKLSENAKEGLKTAWEKLHKGLNNSHRVAILEEGMDYTQIGIPPNDAQFLETRKFQVQEIARIYRVPPHMLADLERATFSNIEHQSIDFVVHTIRPWLVRWEQAIKRKLINETERDKYFAEFLVDGLLRGDTATRYQAHSIARQWGWASANDIREIENQNPLPGDQGDIYLIPMNMIPADQASYEPNEPVIEQNSTAPVEQRNKNAALNRGRITKSYERVFADAAARIVSREVKDLKRAVKKHLGERDNTDFIRYLEDYYKKAPEWIRRTIAPVFATFIEVIQSEAAREVGLDGDIEEFETFAREYAEKFAGHHAGSSERQIKALIRDASTEGTDVGAVLEQRLDEWDDKRSEKIAMGETVRCANAVAKTVFIAAGVTHLRWVSMGSKSCPYCEEMDGRVVGVEQPFLGMNDNLESDDGRMKISRPATHPPLHLGCVCAIVAD